MTSATLVPEDEATRIFSAHRGAIHRFLLSMTRDAAEAEDLTQETLLRAHTKLGTLDDESKLLPWLYRIATNLARDRFRQPSWRHRLAPLEPEDSGPALPVVDTAPRLDKVMEQREMSDCVRKYLEDLADPYRTVILLHDVEGLTNPEMADLLGVSVDAVKIRLHRARTRLREALSAGCSFSQDDRGVTVCEPRSEGERG
jgi:RNA polymerase sigma-70 factor (ECF subfamily)